MYELEQLRRSAQIVTNIQYLLISTPPLTREQKMYLEMLGTASERLFDIYKAGVQLRQREMETLPGERDLRIIHDKS